MKCGSILKCEHRISSDKDSTTKQLKNGPGVDSATLTVIEER